MILFYHRNRKIGRVPLAHDGLASSAACPTPERGIVYVYAPPAWVVGFARPFFKAEAISFQMGKLNGAVHTCLRTNPRGGDCFVAALLKIGRVLVGHNGSASPAAYPTPEREIASSLCSSQPLGWSALQGLSSRPKQSPFR
jgi:hypothetical protein